MQRWMSWRLMMMLADVLDAFPGDDIADGDDLTCDVTI